jgi:hypothetical protein
MRADSEPLTGLEEQEEQAMIDADAIAPVAESDIEMRFEEVEFTPELVVQGLTLWNRPVKDQVMTRLHGSIRDLLQAPWEMWPPTVGVSQISVSTEPRLVVVNGAPPEVTWARVTIFGYGFAPGVPVLTKWNNAFGFPDNGVGKNSILLQTPIPDASGRFAYQVLHKGVLRAAADWVWDGNAQLVIVAQQGTVGSPDWKQADQRYIPPHVLWQWVPYPPVDVATDG